MLPHRKSHILNSFRTLEISHNLKEMAMFMSTLLFESIEQQRTPSPVEPITFMNVTAFSCRIRLRSHSFAYLSTANTVGIFIHDHT